MSLPPDYQQVIQELHNARKQALGIDKEPSDEGGDGYQRPNFFYRPDREAAFARRVRGRDGGERRTATSRSCSTPQIPASMAGAASATWMTAMMAAAAPVTVLAVVAVVAR